MKIPSSLFCCLLAGLCVTQLTETLHAQRRFESSREGPRGGSVDVQGGSVGRFRGGSVEAEGPRGRSVEASGVQTPRYSAGKVTGPNGNTAGGVKFNGYRSGYYYSGGVYRQATVVVNRAYVAPIGLYAGWAVMARPYYISYPVYATAPVEVSVQVELQRRGFYKGTVDGQIGPGTQSAIRAYQTSAGLVVTGTIDKPLVTSLGILGS